MNDIENYSIRSSHISVVSSSRYNLYHYIINMFSPIPPRTNSSYNKLNEREIIDIIISKIRPNVHPSSNKNRIGADDVSIVSLEDANPPTSLAVKCDMIVEGTDVPKGMKPWQIARKS